MEIQRKQELVTRLEAEEHVNSVLLQMEYHGKLKTLEMEAEAREEARRRTDENQRSFDKVTGELRAEIMKVTSDNKLLECTNQHLNEMCSKLKADLSQIKENTTEKELAYKKLQTKVTSLQE